MTPLFAAEVYDRVVPGWRDAPLVCGNRRILCPLHDDHHPSCDIHESKLTWFCRACNRGGGALDLAFAVLGRAGGQALIDELRRAHPNGDDGDEPRPAPGSPQPAREVDVEHLGDPTDDQVTRLIASRRLLSRGTLEAVGARRLRVRWQDDRGSWGASSEWLGFPTRAGGWKLWAIDPDGRPRLDANGRLKRRNLGPSSLIVSPELRHTNGEPILRLYDVEGESDLLAALDAGIPHVLTGTAGAGSLKGHELHTAWLAELAPREVAVIRDLDDAGRSGVVYRPQQAVPPELREQLRACKAALLAELGGRDDASPDPLEQFLADDTIPAAVLHSRALGRDFVLARDLAALDVLTEADQGLPVVFFDEAEKLARLGFQGLRTLLDLRVEFGPSVEVKQVEVGGHA